MTSQEKIRFSKASVFQRRKEDDDDILNVMRHSEEFKAKRADIKAEFEKTNKDSLLDNASPDKPSEIKVAFT